MSEEEQYSSLLTLDFIKTVFKITDTQDDNIWLEIIDSSNQELDTRLHPYVDTPIPPGSNLYARARSIALMFAKSLWAEEQQLLEKSKTLLEKYEIKIKALIDELIANRNNRTKTILARFDPREQKVPLPTQNDLFVSQRFG